MSPSEVFVRDNINYFTDYLLIRDKQRLLCYYVVENKNRNKINRNSFKTAGGSLIDSPISMDYGDFKILKGAICRE